MDYISFELANIFNTFASIDKFKEHCIEKADSINEDGIIYFKDNSYVRFHEGTFSLGAPMEFDF